MNRRFARRNQSPPLAHSVLQVNIVDLVAEYELRHTFRNQGKEAIEAIYAFPVPLDAAFLGMEATLAGERRIAQVQARAQANRQYDDAIADGDSAVLLERLEPGMLGVSLGNLKPGEEGEIVLRFAAALQSADGTARFSLPLVHRPRYGHGYHPHVPDHDFAVEHPLDASIRVTGLLANAPVSCATHGARFSREGDAQVLHLNRAMLDRDLVLVFDLPGDFSGQARLIEDGETAIGLIAFSLPEDRRQQGPCDLCLLLDGSGSMDGDAIEQSRDALRAVAEALGDEDRIQVLRFGSSSVPLFRRPLKASARVREAMTALAETVNCDLGGTDMDAALEKAMDALGGLERTPGRRQAIILVTDGAVHAEQLRDVQKRAIRDGVRVFVVAVGSSAGADVLEPMATATGAVLERAVPAEPIDEGVMRQLRRARQAGPVRVNVDWGTTEARTLPPAIAYAGDAFSAMAMLPGGHGFEVAIRLEGGDLVRSFDLREPENLPALRALVGHVAWLNASAESKEAIALRYGLVTEQTSAVLVKVRAEDDKADGLPQVVSVAHMVPAGMMAKRSRGAMPVAAASAPMPAALAKSALALPSVVYERMPVYRMEDLPVRKPPIAADPGMLDALARALVRHLLVDTATVPTIDSLLDCLDPKLRDEAAAYLESRGIDALNGRRLWELLEELLLRMPDLALSDDQEAVLASRRHEEER